MPQHSRVDAARGATRLGIALALLAAFIAAYLAQRYGPAYWAYACMLTPVREAAVTAAAHAWDREPDIERRKRAWRTELIGKAQAIGVALGDDGVDIERTDTEAVVRASWRVPVRHPYLRHTLEFRIESRQPLLPD